MTLTRKKGARCLLRPQLKEDGVPIDLSEAERIAVTIAHPTTGSYYFAPVAVTADPPADWRNGVVNIALDSASTAMVTPGQVDVVVLVYWTDSDESVDAYPFRIIIKP